MHKTWWIGCNWENWHREQFLPRFILTVCKLQPEILINLTNIHWLSRCTINAYFIILRISGLSLYTVRINPGKNCAPVFFIANHQQFRNIFSTKYWVGFFSPSLLIQVFFYSDLPCRIFQNHPPHSPPPSKVKRSTLLICIILDHAFKIKFWSHRRHIGTPGPVFFAGVRVSF